MRMQLRICVASDMYLPSPVCQQTHPEARTTNMAYWKDYKSKQLCSPGSQRERERLSESGSYHELALSLTTEGYRKSSPRCLWNSGFVP